MTHPLVARRQLQRSQRGVVSLLFALLLPVLLGLGALAVDFPYMLTVRAELQTVADTAALAAGRYLDDGGVPNWSQVVSTGQSAVGYNLADRKTIDQADIQVGYWDVSSNQAGLQLLPMTPTPTDVPAVRVSLSRSTGRNGGEVSAIFANFLGVGSLPISVTAVAARAGPSTIDANVLFPLAMPKCMYDNYWNASSTPPGPKIDPITNSIFTFQIGTKTYAGCDVNGIKFPAGAWATLDNSQSNSNDLQSLVGTRLAKSLSIGDQLWINSGNFSAQLYNTVNKCSAAGPPGSQTCRFVSIPVFENKSTTGFNSLVGFACIEILNAQGGSAKYVEVRMSKSCATPPSSGIGPGFGVTAPAKLFL